MKKANADIRALLKEKRIPVYAVAHEMGVHDNTVFRKLRFELSDNEKKAICDIINKIADR